MQEEKEELEHKVIELETKVHRATSDRLLQEENDQEMEAEMNRMRRDLEEARKAEIMLQERLQNNATETAHEKDVLRSKNTVLTEALKRIEKDYTECKTMYNERLQEVISKNEQLEMEIEEMKRNYGQQMNEFEHELAEIEKSHTTKVEEYENTIAALNKRTAELEEFCETKTKDVYILKEKFEEYIKYMEQKQALGAQAAANGYFFGRNNNPRLDISDKISQSLLSPVHAFQNESDFLLTASKSPGHEFNIDLDTSKKMRSPDGLTSTERLLINSGRGLKSSPRGGLQITTEREKFESFRPKSASRSPLAQARERDVDNYASGGSASKVGNRSIQEDRESANFPRGNLSFGNQESSARSGLENLKNLNLADITNSMIRRHREELGTSLRGSTRSMYSQKSVAIGEKIATRERELIRLNEEYQVLLRRTQETDDSKERSRMRGELIRLTEDIHKINENISQLKKEAIAM